LIASRLWISAAPGLLVAVYLTASVFLYFEGPIAWPTPDSPLLLTFLSFAILSIIAGFSFALNMPSSAGFAMPIKTMLVAGSILSIVILFLASYAYTGQPPWAVFSALADQRAAYEGMLSQVNQGSGSRTLIALVRSVGFILIVAVVPLGVVHARRLGWPVRMAVLACALSGVVFSILRGTDKEIADLAIFVGGALLVLAGRGLARDAGRVWRLATSRAGLAIILVLIVAAVGALGLFSARKAARLGGVSEVCISDMRICADPQNWMIAPLPEAAKFTVSMLTGYIAQGYFGVSLALELPFTPMWGVGNSSLATRAYEAATGDTGLYQESYTYQLRTVGWSDLTQWSSLFTWFANDFGFPFAAVIVGVIAFAAGVAWRDAVFGRNDAAVVVFCILLQMLVYAPANNQVLQTLDSTLALGTWFLIWLVSRLSTSRRLGQEPAR
jgi:hypothetical protein